MSYDEVKQDIRERILDSYRNGQKASGQSPAERSPEKKGVSKRSKTTTNFTMKTYLVSVSQEMCADFEVEAETPQLAEEKALHGDRSMSSDDWCEGHRGSRKILAIEEIGE